MIMKFLGNLSSVSECTTNAQFTSYKSRVWFLQALTSPGLHFPISLPLRNTIKGLVKITKCHAPDLILWTSAIESRRYHPTLGNPLHVGGCEWQDGVTSSAHAQLQERNSASAVCLAQPSTENIILESRCRYKAASLWCQARCETSATGMQTWKLNTINHEGAAASANQRVAFHLAKTNTIWEKRNNCSHI